MKPSQVRLFYIVLVVIGVAGFVLRVLSGGSGDSTLSGLPPLTEDTVDYVIIESPSAQAELFNIGAEWRVGAFPTSPPRVSEFWNAVVRLPSAQLVATNPASHELLGVDNESGTRVTFRQGIEVLGTVVIGRWSPRSGLAYLRQPLSSDVYSLPLDLPGIFDANPASWRSAVVTSIPVGEVSSLTVARGADALTLQREAGAWTLSTDEGEVQADAGRVLETLQLLDPLVAIGFASTEEAASLDLSDPDGSVGVVTSAGSRRLGFLRRDETSYYVQMDNDIAVFVVAAEVAEGLLKGPGDFLPSS